MRDLVIVLLCAVVVFGPFAVRVVVYEVRHWRHARNLVRIRQAEPVGWDRRFYGSMSLADERGISPAGYLRGLGGLLSSTTTNLARGPDDPYDPADDEPYGWLPAEPPSEAEVAASRAAHGYIPELDTDQPAIDLDDLSLPAELQWELENSGPGVLESSLTPGPDPMWEYHADHPAVLPERACLPVLELGPRAQAVLDRWEARYQERWAFA